MQKKLPQLIVGILVVGIISFYGGMKYGENKTTTSIGGGSLTQGQQRGAGQFGSANGGIRAGGGNRGGAAGGGFANGEVVSLDSKSLTVKMRDGSSKIIILSTSTQILKSSTGILTDVAVGSQVTITGGPNSDGSITAQSIQIRPSMPTSTPFTK